MKKTLIFFSLIILIFFTFLTCSSDEKKAVVGAKNFTEQYILGNMLSLLLQDNGYKVEEKFGTGSSVTRQALTSGQTDLYPEYTGTAWSVYLKHDELIPDSKELYDKVAKEDEDKNDIVWVGRAPLNNTYAMAIKESNVAKYGSTLSDLANYENKGSNDLIYAVDHEFYERPDGFWKMADVYGMDIPEGNVKTMDIGLSFEAIDRDQVDVSMVFATDGKLKKFNLTVLDDDKNFFPIYNISVCVRKEFLDKYPDLKGKFEKLLSYLDNETMQKLNYEVDVEGKDEKALAKEFLKSKNLIKD
jgi:osmoprotectant transport system substrate-binding protein